MSSGIYRSASLVLMRVENVKFEMPVGSAFVWRDPSSKGKLWFSAQRLPCTAGRPGCPRTSSPTESPSARSDARGGRAVGMPAANVPSSCWWSGRSRVSQLDGGGGSNDCDQCVAWRESPVVIFSADGRGRICCSVKGGRQGRQRKRWEDNIREWTGLEFGRSKRAVENRERWRKLVATSFAMPQRPSRLRDRWWWWWLWQRGCCFSRLLCGFALMTMVLAFLKVDDLSCTFLVPVFAVSLPSMLQWESIYFIHKTSTWQAHSAG